MEGASRRREPRKQRQAHSRAAKEYSELQDDNYSRRHPWTETVILHSQRKLSFLYPHQCQSCRILTQPRNHCHLQTGGTEDRKLEHLEDT